MNAAAIILTTVLVFAIAGLLVWATAKVTEWDMARTDAQYGITRDRSGSIVAYVAREDR